MGHGIHRRTWGIRHQLQHQVKIKANPSSMTTSMKRFEEKLKQTHSLFRWRSAQTHQQTRVKIGANPTSNSSEDRRKPIIFSGVCRRLSKKKQPSPPSSSLASSSSLVAAFLFKFMD
jgi:hypothetical protein